MTEFRQNYDSSIKVNSSVHKALGCVGTVIDGAVRSSIDYFSSLFFFRDVEEMLIDCFSSLFRCWLIVCNIFSSTETWTRWLMSASKQSRGSFALVTHTLGRSGNFFFWSDLSFPQDGAFKFLVVNVGENNNLNLNLDLTFLERRGENNFWKI